LVAPWLQFWASSNGCFPGSGSLLTVCSVFPVEIKRTRQVVEQQFGFAEIQLLGFNDLYAGKFCAALDRQHPRDLVDFKLLLENDGIGDDLIKVFLVYLIAHNRPISELLQPNLIDITASYHREFVDTVVEPISQDELERVRENFISLIKKNLSDTDKQFLMSVKKLNPNWQYLDWEHISELPAVRWKMYNLAKMNKKKHLQAVAKLEAVLYG